MGSVPGLGNKMLHAMLCSEKKKRCKSCVFMSWAQKGSEDTSNFKKDREAKALHLALFGLLVVNGN